MQIVLKPLILLISHAILSKTGFKICELYSLQPEQDGLRLPQDYPAVYIEPTLDFEQRATRGKVEMTARINLHAVFHSLDEFDVRLGADNTLITGTRLIEMDLVDALWQSVEGLNKKEGNLELLPLRMQRYYYRTDITALSVWTIETVQKISLCLPPH